MKKWNSLFMVLVFILFNSFIYAQTPIDDNTKVGIALSKSLTIGGKWAQIHFADDTIQSTAANGTLSAGGWIHDGVVVRLSNVGDFVGIGTVTPNAPLAIAQSSDDTSIKLIGFDDRSDEFVTIGLNQFGNLRFTGSVGGRTTNFADMNFKLDNDREIVFGNSNDYSIGHISATDSFNIADGLDASVNARLSINNLGNVGLGTETPAAKLHLTQIEDNSGIQINGFDDHSDDNIIIGMASTGFLRFASNVADPTVAFFDMNSKLNDNREAVFGNGDDYSIGYHGTSDTFRLADGKNVGSNVRLTLTPDGSIGIGTTTPSRPLEVVGNMHEFGHMYVVDNSTTTTIPLINVWTEVDNLLAGSSTSNISIASSDMTVNAAGNYLLNFDGSIDGADGILFEFGVSINDVISELIRGTDKSGISNDEISIGLSGVLHLNAGDIVKLEIRNKSDATNVLFVNVGFVLSQL